MRKRALGHLAHDCVAFGEGLAGADDLGQVVVDRVASPKAQNLTLKTEALTVYPDEERMETDVPVDILTGSSRINGVGMKANNATGVVEVQNALRIVLPPKPRPGAAAK